MYTKLQAVNKLLRGASIEPVTSLEFPDSDVAMAVAALDESTIETLTIGWWFNIENNWELLLDEQGRASLPGSTLSMQGNQLLCGRAITKRGGYVYDMSTHSTDLSKLKTPQDGVNLNLTMLLDWEDCPSTAQNFIMVKAARRFALDVDLDPNKVQFNQADEATALGILQRDDLRNKQLNSLNSPMTSTFLGALNSPNSFGGGGGLNGLNPSGSHDYYE